MIALIYFQNVTIFNIFSGFFELGYYLANKNTHMDKFFKLTNVLTNRLQLHSKKILNKYKSLLKHL